MATRRMNPDKTSCLGGNGGNRRGAFGGGQGAGFGGGGLNGQKGGAGGRNPGKKKTNQKKTFRGGARVVWGGKTK